MNKETFDKAAKIQSQINELKDKLVKIVNAIQIAEDAAAHSTHKPIAEEDHYKVFINAGNSVLDQIPLFIEPVEFLQSIKDTYEFQIEQLQKRFDLL